MGSVHNSGDLFVYLSNCLSNCLSVCWKLGAIASCTVCVLCWCTVVQFIQASLDPWIYPTNFNALHGVTYLLMNSSSTTVECILWYSVNVVYVLLYSLQTTVQLMYGNEQFWVPEAAGGGGEAGGGSQHEWERAALGSQADSTHCTALDTRTRQVHAYKNTPFSWKHFSQHMYVYSIILLQLRFFLNW